VADHIWTVLCNKMLVDPESQVISLVDVTESLEVEGLEQQIEEALHSGKKGALVNAVTRLVSWWFRSDTNEETLQARVVLLSPSGESLMVQPVNAPWGQDKLFLRITINLNKLPVSMPGLFWFVVEQQKKSKSQKPRWVALTRVPLYIGPV
jgi:hypothetical protein